MEGIRAEDVVAAIRGTNGYVHVIADRLACSRRHVYRLLDKYATAREALEEEREKRKDFYEAQLDKRINAGSERLLQFALSTFAKDRGYGKDPLVEVNQSSTIVVEVSLPPLELCPNDDERARVHAMTNGHRSNGASSD